MGKKHDSSVYRVENFDVPEYDYQISLQKPSQRKKVIKRIESIVRSSMEYRDYIQYLKDYMDMRQCAFFPNINNQGGENKRIKIEIHHEPFTLYDLVSVVLDKQIALGYPINELYIAEEVMKLHYDNMVGLVPLSKTIHQIITRSNKIFVPLPMVYGDYKKFLVDYEEWIPDYMLEKLDQKILESQSVQEDSFKAVERKYTYVNVDGIVLPQRMEEENQTGEKD